MSKEKYLTINSNCGFTLIEILISVTILSTALLGIASLTGVSIKGNKTSRAITQGTSYINSKVEYLKNLGLSNFDHADLSAGTHTDYLDINGSTVNQNSSSKYYTRAYTITDDSTGNLKTIDFTIDREDSGKTKTISLTILVSR